MDLLGTLIPKHYEFLAQDASDPRREFIGSLCSGLGDKGSIVVYSSFESQRLSELASWFAEFADRIGKSKAACCSLCGSTFTIQHSRGSYSIKSVLRAVMRN